MSFGDIQQYNDDYDITVHHVQAMNQTCTVRMDVKADDVCFSATALEVIDVGSIYQARFLRDRVLGHMLETTLLFELLLRASISGTKFFFVTVKVLKNLHILEDLLHVSSPTTFFSQQQQCFIVAFDDIFDDDHVPVDGDVPLTHDDSLISNVNISFGVVTTNSVSSFYIEFISWVQHF